MDKTYLKKLKTVKLRELASEKGVEGADTLERQDLIEAMAASAKSGGGKKDSKSSKKRKKTVKAQEEEQQDEDQEEDTGSEEPDKEKEQQVGSFIQPGFVTETGGLSPNARRMKEKLINQPRITIMIPLGEGEPSGVTQSVCLDGYRLNIIKGQYVPVPKQVAEVIMRSQQMDREAVDNYFHMSEEDGLSQAMRDKLRGPAPAVEGKR